MKCCAFVTCIFWVLFQITHASILSNRKSAGHQPILKGDSDVVTAFPEPRTSFFDRIVKGLQFQRDQFFQESQKVLDVSHKELLQLRNSPGSNEEEEMTMFRRRDIWSWVIFTAVFFILIIFDNVVLHRRNETLGFGKACCYTIFWIFLALLFCVYIYFSRGLNDAFEWGVGYTLEWMLSVDNLFVFHLVFKLYGTPDRLKHKPLFYGIVGAVFFRLIFFAVEGALLHALWWMHFVFGIFLIYTGIKSAMSDDEDEDPRDNRLMKCLSSRLRFINGYDSEGAFFVRVPLDANGDPIMPAVAPPSPKGKKGDETPEDEEKVIVYQAGQWYQTPRHGETPSRHGFAHGYQWRATTLLLVVICLEATDIIFAVDSVSAIIAEIPDLYLAYTACVFAMLGLRAMFFVIEKAITLFEYLKYGVAAILVFIGVKLMLKTWLHIPKWAVLLILVGTLVTCILASVIKQKCCPKPADDDTD